MSSRRLLIILSIIFIVAIIGGSLLWYETSGKNDKDKAPIRALAAASIRGPEAAPAPMPDALPSWVTTNTNDNKRKDWPELQAVTKGKIDEASHPLDLLLFGDSITAFHSGMLVGKVQGTPEIWNKYFGTHNTLTLGIPGDKVGNVAWRLMKGGEKPPIDPKVVVLHVGVNDIALLPHSANPDAAGRMDYLLGWMRSHMPGSRIAVMAILPTTFFNFRKLNVALQPVVSRHGALWIECGQEINPRDTIYIADHVHPTAAGHEIILECLAENLHAII